jgi:glutathione S-transferase
MTGLKLILGNKNYSSWSLRPWIAMRQAGIGFDEEVVRLDFDADGPGNAHLKDYSPAGRVPVLFHGETAIWESLAILEYVAELYPEKALWPEDRPTRARARTAANEMHASFGGLRSELPMNMRRAPSKVAHSADAAGDIERVQQIWNDCRAAHANDGPFLFGAFSIADAMYAPVVSRLTVYDIALHGASAAYAETILALAAYREWKAAAEAEPWVIGSEERDPL